MPVKEDEVPRSPGWANSLVESTRVIDSHSIETLSSHEASTRRAIESSEASPS